MSASVPPRRCPFFRRACTTGASALLLLLLGACGTAGHSSAVVTDSAAVQHGGNRLEMTGDDAARADLAFFDSLASQSVVSRNDLLHAALLVGAGSSGGTYTQRAAFSRELGWIEPAWPAGASAANQPATIGDAASVFDALIGRRTAAPRPVALARLTDAGILPEDARVDQPVNGAQVVSLIGAASDSLGGTPIAMLDGSGAVLIGSPSRASAAADGGESFDDFGTALPPAPAVRTAAPDRSVPLPAASTAPKPRPEPLPPLASTAAATAPTPARAAQPPQPSQPAPPAPPAPPAEPMRGAAAEPEAPAPAPEVAKPRTAWTKGKPVRKEPAQGTEPAKP